MVLLLAFLGYAAFIRQTPGSASPTGVNTLPPVARRRPIASLSVARSGLAVVAYENQIYTIGGETEQGVVGKVDLYRVELDTWELKKAKPLAVADINAAVIGGLIYVPGGRLASGEPTDVVEAFDPVANRWEGRASLPVPLSAYAGRF